MSSQSPTQHVALGVTLGLLGGLLFFRALQFEYVGLPFSVCVAVLLAHALFVQGFPINRPRVSWMIGLIARACAVGAGALCFTFVTMSITETIALGYFKAEDSTLAHLFHIGTFAEASTWFAVFLGLRAFIRDPRPVATIIAASMLLVIVWTIVPRFALISIEVAIAWMSVLALFAAMMFRADLVAFGVDIGQKKTAEPGATDKPDDAQRSREEH